MNSWLLTGLFIVEASILMVWTIWRRPMRNAWWCWRHHVKAGEYYRIEYLNEHDVSIIKILDVQYSWKQRNGIRIKYELIKVISGRGPSLMSLFEHKGPVVDTMTEFLLRDIQHLTEEEATAWLL